VTMPARWVLARLEEIPDEWLLADRTALSDEEALAIVGRRDPRALARWNAFEARYPEILERLSVHDVRRHVSPEVRREGFALASPTRVLVVGGIPGEAYEPPPFHLDAPESTGSR
jgi:hypothetical protein